MSSIWHSNWRDKKLKIKGTENPDFLQGTSDRDKIFALGGDDTVRGSTGNDSIDGGLGMDTLDLQDLGTPIKVNFSHVNGSYFTAQIKSDVGNINASDFDVFIAPVNQNNTIDRSKSSSTPPLTIDLDEGIYYESVKYGAFAQIQNFTNAIGSPYGDYITGNSANNLLVGGKFSDRIDGKDGNDTLSGSDKDGRGTDERDLLTGGAGEDKFVLGDKNGSYYKNGSHHFEAGEIFNFDDFAIITDFNRGDLIQLGRGGDTYKLVRNDPSYEVQERLNITPQNNAIGFDLMLTTGSSDQIVAKVFTSSSDIFNDVTYPEGSEFYMGNTKDTLGGVFVGM